MASALGDGGEFDGFGTHPIVGDGFLTRIMDVSPRLEHTLSLAALTQAIVRMLMRLRARNLRWREYDRFLIGENRWRAQRYRLHEPGGR